MVIAQAKVQGNILTSLFLPHVTSTPSVHPISSTFKVIPDTTGSHHLLCYLPGPRAFHLSFPSLPLSLLPIASLTVWNVSEVSAIFYSKPSVKAKDPAMAWTLTGGLDSITCLTSPPSLFISLALHWPAFFVFNLLGTCRPQGLCTSCLFSLLYPPPSPISAWCTASFLQISAQWALLLPTSSLFLHWNADNLDEMN